MARTDAEKVAEVIEVDDTIDLDIFITLANEIVTEHLGDSVLTATRLELIERNLAAYYYAALRDRQVTSESFGGVSFSYQGQVALGFNLNHWGQVAMQLDSTGTLAALDEQTTNPTLTPTATVPMIDFASVESEEDFPRD